ncbi:MAG: hypothetical protein MRY83_19470, partial [Flavobacteriales bacterium]|nr:hypothetical protein [Flavobacteriales bacterium]
DASGRLIRKSIPSKGEMLMYYDRLNRPVLMVDGNGDKVFKKYDVLGREIISGTYHGNALPTNGDDLYEIPVSSSIGYTAGLSFPQNNFFISSINYFDHYDFNRNGIIELDEEHDVDQLGVFNEPNAITHGKLLRKSTALLNGNWESYNTAIDYSNKTFFYNKRNEVLQCKSQHPITGSDVEMNLYDFNDLVIKNVRKHRNIINGTKHSFNILTENTYDHFGRLIDVFKSINGASPNHVVHYDYNERDLLKTRWLGLNNADALQKIDYSYNIRNWLTHINDFYSGPVDKEVFQNQSGVKRPQ